MVTELYRRWAGSGVTFFLALLAVALAPALGGPATQAQTGTNVTGTFQTQERKTPSAAGLKVLATIGATPVYGSFDAVATDTAGNRVREITCGTPQITYLPQNVRGWIKGDGTLMNSGETAGVTLAPTMGCSPAGLAYRVTISLTGDAATNGGRLKPVSIIQDKAIPDQASVDWASLPAAGIQALVYTGYSTIQEEGASLAVRNTLNFMGAGSTCVDNAGATRTDCTITGGGGGSLTVREVDLTPSVASVATLEFNQAVGLTVADQTGGVARVSLAAVPDSALAQIATASKVSGAALTSLASIPAGAGVIPAANLPATISYLGSSIDLASEVAGQLPLANLTPGTANQLYKANAAATAIEQATLAVGTAGTDFAVGFAAGTITLNLPTASASNRGALSTADWSIFNAKESALTFSSPLSRSVNTISCTTCEVTGNKNTASGYAGLTAGTKLTLAQGQEVWSIADLTEYASSSGTGTAAIRATITAPGATHYLGWDGANWINRAIATGDLPASVSLLGQTIEDGEITSITTRSKLPAAIAYEDEPNIFTAVGGITLDNELSLRLREATVNGVNFIAHKAPPALAADATFTWFAPAAGFIRTDVAGALSAAAASGIGGCTNQFVRTLNDNAAPTCATVSLTLDVSGVLPDANVADTITLTNITQITNRAVTDTTGDLPASRVDDGAMASTQALFSGGAGAAGFRAIAAGDFPAGYIDATTDFAGALCGTGQILEDQGAAWACIATPAGGGAHNMLSTTHTDSTAAAAARGGLIVGKTATPKWELLVVGGAATFLRSDGTDALWAAIADGDVPNNITIDLAAVATTANAGDSATAFFPSGTLEDARLSANVSLLGQTIEDAELTSITTRSKLPAPLVYDDEPNTYGAFLQNFAAGKLVLPNSASVPATCTVGERYFDNDARTGQQDWLCTATNIWRVIEEPVIHATSYGVKADTKRVANNVSTTIGSGVVTTPPSATIVAGTGASRTSNVVTITTTAAHNFQIGSTVVIAGVTDSSFNGSFPIASVPTTTTLTYAQTAGNATSGSGTASVPQFTSADVGKTAWVFKTNQAAIIVASTITTVNSSTSITLSNVANQTASVNVILIWGTDDSNALVAAYAAAKAAGTTGGGQLGGGAYAPSQARLILPAGLILFAKQIFKIDGATEFASVEIVGQGPDISVFVASEGFVFPTDLGMLFTSINSGRTVLRNFGVDVQTTFFSAWPSNNTLGFTVINQGIGELWDLHLTGTSLQQTVGDKLLMLRLPTSGQRNYNLRVEGNYGPAVKVLGSNIEAYGLEVANNRDNQMRIVNASDFYWFGGLLDEASGDLNFLSLENAKRIILEGLRVISSGGTASNAIKVDANSSVVLIGSTIFGSSLATGDGLDISAGGEARILASRFEHVNATGFAINNAGTVYDLGGNVIDAGKYNGTLAIVPFDAANAIRLNAAALAGRYLKGDGANFVMSAGSASGTGACTNQFTRALNSDAAPTCASVSLTADVTGQLPLANLTPGTANQLYKANAAATAIEQATLAVGTAGTDFAVAFAAGTITLNLPTASASNRGALSTADWSTFNAKESALTFSSPLSRSVNTISCPTCTTNAAALTVDQVVVGAAGNAVKILAAGGAATVLTMSGGVPTWSAPGGGTSHAILSATHTDTTAATVVRGDLMVGQTATPVWQRLALGAANTFLGSNATDAAWTAPTGGGSVLGTGRALTGGAGIGALGDLSADRTIATASGETDFLASGALTCGAAAQGRMQVHTTPLQYCDNAATPVLQYAAYGTSIGEAITGDSATAFFATGTIEDARLSANVSLLGSSISLTTEVTGILPGANGGTNNGFMDFTGPATSLKTFTLPNASATILTTNAVVTGAQGGTNNAFFEVTGPATSLKTFTFPNASATVLTSNAAVTVAQGGTGLTAGTSGGILGFTAAGTLASSALLTLNGVVLGGGAGATPTSTAAGAANEVLRVPGGGGAPAFGAVDLAAAAAITGLLPDANIAASITRDTEWPSATATLTNKTLDVEDTGNVITTVSKVALMAAACQNATATLLWDTPTTSPAVAACITGTNTQKGVADFADAANLSMQTTFPLPSDWTSTGGVDARFKWLTTATTGDVVWQLATICVADAETDDPAFNTASTVTDTAKGTTNQTNDATITGLTMTGCAAGELLHLKLFRDSAHASDTLAATARLVSLELTLRRAQ